MKTTPLLSLALLFLFTLSACSFDTTGEKDKQIEQLQLQIQELQKRSATPATPEVSPQISPIPTAIPVTSTPEPSQKETYTPLPSGDFKKVSVADPAHSTEFKGSLYARGYITTEKVVVPVEGDPAHEEYVYFTMEEYTPQKGVEDYFGKNKKKIFIGCLKNEKKISYINYEGGEHSFSSSAVQKILASNKNNMITLKMTTKLYETGFGPPACFTPFSFEVL
ncbi:MAG: hypothetical protein WCJ84_06340 [Candidatus Peregrinibacteria bacterium]